LAELSSATKQVRDIFKGILGENLTSCSAHAFTGLQTWAHLLDKAGSTDPVASCETCNGIEITVEELILAWEGIKFDETGHNLLGRGLSGQYQDQQLEVAFPFELATADMVYLLPAGCEVERGGFYTAELP
jgi:branched-chain amino acid transport system substrate-binding protein